MELDGMVGRPREMSESDWLRATHQEGHQQHANGDALLYVLGGGVSALRLLGCVM